MHRHNSYQIVMEADATLDHEALSAAVTDVIERFDPSAPEQLEILLEAENPVVLRRALYIFGALGRKGYAVLDAALAHAKNPSVALRSNLLDGVLAYPSWLSPAQAQQILPLASDEEPLVRQKVVAFIGAAKIETLKDAVHLIADHTRKEHEIGLGILTDWSGDPQRLFESALKETTIKSTYALAALERMARAGENVDLQYAGNDHMGEAVAANIKRLAQRRKK